jgi:hypothetical protein
LAPTAVVGSAVACALKPIAIEPAKLANER